MTEREKHNIQLEIISGYRNKIVLDNLTAEQVLDMLDSDYQYLEQENALISTNEWLDESPSIPEQGKEKEVSVHETILHAMGFSSVFTSDPQEGYHASKRFNKGDFVIHMPDEAEQLFVDENGNEVKYLSGLLKLLSTHPETKEAEKEVK